MNKRSLLKFSLIAPLAFAAGRAHATNLSLGADYLLRNVSIQERDKNIASNNYYDQRLQGYMITDLSKDVEATIRVQSITAWGQETSTTSLATRYPNGDGQFWVQNAFVRMPNIWQNRIIATAGRQPITWGDGLVLSDDDLGFNALRLQVRSPWERIPFDIDAFTAQIDESFRANKDHTLNGAMLGFDRSYVRWELMGLWETDKRDQQYETGASTGTAINVSDIAREIYGIRAAANLQDAYMKGAYFLQKGKVKQPSSLNQEDIKLAGTAYMFGLGGKSNSKKFGRFGAQLDYMYGDGDKPETPDKDEAFRPTFASRWDGLERKGQGRYFASTFSDAYDPTDPFAPVTSTHDGLPIGVSEIQTIHFGVDSTPWAQWTFSGDYYQYKAQRSTSGPKDLGTEFDFGIVFRYSGLVTINGTYNQFRPGQAFEQLAPGQTESTAQKAKRIDLSLQLSF